MSTSLTWKAAARDEAIFASHSLRGSGEASFVNTAHRSANDTADLISRYEKMLVRHVRIACGHFITAMTKQPAHQRQVLSRHDRVTCGGVAEVMEPEAVEICARAKGVPAATMTLSRVRRCRRAKRVSAAGRFCDAQDDVRCLVPFRTSDPATVLMASVGTGKSRHRVEIHCIGDEAPNLHRGLDQVPSSR